MEGVKYVIAWVGGLWVWFCAADLMAMVPKR
jgi:hypothetical protein